MTDRRATRDHKEFKPAVYKCPYCSARLVSSYPGEFVQCHCVTECFVDQTEDYIRLGGHKQPVLWLPPDMELELAPYFTIERRAGKVMGWSYIGSPTDLNEERLTKAINTLYETASKLEQMRDEL